MGQDAKVLDDDGRGAGDSPTLAALDGLLDGESLVRAGCAVPYPVAAVGKRLVAHFVDAYC